MYAASRSQRPSCRWWPAAALIVPYTPPHATLGPNSETTCVMSAQSVGTRCDLYVFARK